MKYRQLLGQHFLKERGIAEKIVEAAEISAEDFVVEIGSGRGELTFPLLKKGCQLLAIEKDRQLGEGLRRKIKNPKFKIIIDNALFRFPYLELPKNWKLVSNLPYSITSPILNLILKGGKRGEPSPPLLAILMVQKEVAERLVAPPGKSERGLLTVLAEYYAQVKFLFEVPRKSFLPIPQVDSAVIKITDFRRPPKREADRLEFLLKAGFAHKRALLKNSLFFSLKISPKKIKELLAQAKIPHSARAEDLTLQDWLNLSQSLAKILKDGKL